MASEPPVPPILKYRLSTAKNVMGGTEITAHAVTAVGKILLKERLQTDGHRAIRPQAGAASVGNLDDLVASEFGDHEVDPTIRRNER